MSKYSLTVVGLRRLGENGLRSQKAMVYSKCNWKGVVCRTRAIFIEFGLNKESPGTNHLLACRTWAWPCMGKFLHSTRGRAGGTFVMRDFHNYFLVKRPFYPCDS